MLHNHEKGASKMRLVKKIGLLFSMTGTTSIVEDGQHKAALLSIEEINENDNNKVQLTPFFEDIQSDPQVAAQKARKLIEEDKVDILVGCYTSACRKAVLPVLEEKSIYLFYPTIYEGMECHSQVFYCGPVPNQQIEMMLSWAVENLGNSFILVGNDYIYPRLTNEQAKKWIERAGGVTVAEEYFPLGCVEFNNKIAEIQKHESQNKPIVLLSTLVGKSVPAFYKQYKLRGVHFPIISPITSEKEVFLMGKDAAEGHYCVSSYFQTIDNKKNINFKNKFHERFGNEPICGVMEGAYIAVSLIAEGYNQMSKHLLSEKNCHEKFCNIIKNLTLEAPQGKIMVDGRNQHLWLWSRIGRVTPSGDIEVVWTSPGPLPPRPFGEETEHWDKASGYKHIENNKKGFNRIIGSNKQLLDKLSIARIASRTSCNVLITGESGTGKELFAKAIHEECSHRNGPLVPINCAAIPQNLIASELFGYEEGTFTGAKKGGKIGLFEQANGGTLLLDEIGEMPLDLQAYLLRVLQEKEIYRVGGNKAIPVDVRIISLTNKDLMQEIAWNGTFRSDLFYRLNVFSIEIPPLRKMKGDVEALANHFLDQFNKANRNTQKKLSSGALEVLTEYSWPGNVRELANILERAFYMALHSPVILLEHLPEEIINNSLVHIELESPTMNQAKQHELSIDKNEKNIIEHALNVSGYNISKASRMLEISRSTLYRKIKKHAINIDDSSK